MIPAFLSELVRIIIIMTITGGLLCLLLLAIKPLIRHRLPKAAQYSFWLVVIFAFLIPISYFVALPGTTVNVIPIRSTVERHVISIHEETVRMLELEDAPWQAYAAINNISENAVRTVRPDFVPPPELPPAGFAIVSNIFMLVYPLAVLFVLTYSLIGYVQFMRKLRRGYIKPQHFELDILDELTKGKFTPRLFKSIYVATPMLVGIFKPTIILPDREYSTEQLYGILLHELTHMRRFDVLVKWLSLLACAAHWFNPLVWVARRQIDRACELACDEAVIRNMDAYSMQNYGETLIAVATAEKIPLPVLSTTMCSEKKAIKERLSAIMKNKKHTKKTILLSGIILLGIVLTACALGAGGGSSGNGNTDENDTFMDRVVADGVRVFVLENMTDRERLERMTSVTLYADGTATLANALISSFMLPGAPYTTFTVEDNALSIFQNIPGSVRDESNDDAVARFAIIDNDTLEFLYASLPLFADAGARYVFNPDGFDIFAEVDFGIESIPYVGAAHETQSIVNTMPLPRRDMTLRSIQIGADHGGFGYGAYTLTIHYDLHGDNLEDAPGAAFARISARLFDHIDNLQAVTFSVVGNEETSTDNYIYRWSISRTSSDAGGGAITSFRGTHSSAGQAETQFGSNERVDLRSLMLRDIADVQHMLGEQIGSSDEVGMWATYNFESGLSVSVNDSRQIVSIMLDYNQADNRSQFQFDGINGTSVYADVVSRFGNPYTIRAGPDEAHVGAVNAYGYFYGWHEFVYFFFDAGGNVVAISVFFSEATITPFVREDGGVLAVHGFGGRVYFHRGTAIEMPFIFFAGHRFPIPQLENETIEGSVRLTQDSLVISLVVARNEIIIEQVDGPLGTIAGPWLEFEYIQGIGITAMTNHPFVFDNGHEPLHFELDEENALALAEMMRRVMEVVDSHLNPVY